jgi:hypothetical protein
MNHTPGPWEVVQGHYPSFKDVVGPSFKLSVVMSATDLDQTDYEARLADLHLIASAPDLFEALNNIVLLQEKHYGDGSALHMAMIKAAENARLVLAKALGVPPVHNNNRG